MQDEYDALKYENCGCRIGWHKELKIAKMKVEENVADGLTKQVDRQKMEQCVEACGMARRSGRRELSPQLGESL